MRIWHQSAAPLAAMGSYQKSLARHVSSIVAPGTEVVFHGLDAAMYAGHAPADVLKYPYLRHLILGRIVEACIEAERAGFDAVALAAFNDPFVREARAVVDIPVVSMAETSLLAGCAMAKRLALVTLTPENVWRLREIVERHELEKRVTGIFPLEPRMTERDLMQGFESPERIVRQFTDTAAHAVSEGAELLIPAEGVLNEVLFQHRCHRVHDTPVLDCVGVTFLHAEVMVRLRRATGFTPSRVWDHARPADELLQQVRQAVGFAQYPEDRGPR